MLLNILHESEDETCYSEGYPESLNISVLKNIEIGVCYPSGCSLNEFATVLSKVSAW